MTNNTSYTRHFNGKHSDLILGAVALTTPRGMDRGVDLNTGERRAELSGIERSALQEYERRIERGIRAFVEMGDSLRAIRDNRLYRTEYSTFEEYCEHRWELKQSRAYQLMDAAEAIEVLKSSTIVELPANEAQTRPLTTLAPDQQVAAWREAVETAPNRKPTAAHVETVAAKYRATDPESDDADTQELDAVDPPRPTIAEVVVAAHRDAFTEAPEAVQELIMQHLSPDNPAWFTVDLMQWLTIGYQQNRAWWAELRDSGGIQPDEEDSRVELTDGLLALQGAVRQRERIHAQMAKDSQQATLEAMHSSKSVNWYTPARYIEAARRTLDGIDLDPATCEEANETVQAEWVFTESDDGLKQEWFDHVWLNPPYGKDGGVSRQAVWSAKLIQEYKSGRVTAAVLLVSASTSEKWFQPLRNCPLCLTDHRINFNAPEGQDASGSNHGSAFIYFGNDVEAFVKHFSPFGRVILPRGSVSVQA